MIILTYFTFMPMKRKSISTLPQFWQKCLEVIFHHQLNQQLRQEPQQLLQPYLKLSVIAQIQTIRH